MDEQYSVGIDYRRMGFPLIFPIISYRLNPRYTIERKLRNVEALHQQEVVKYLGDGSDLDGEDETGSIEPEKSE
jgi:hypothetical protein